MRAQEASSLLRTGFILGDAAAPELPDGLIGTSGQCLRTRTSARSRHCACRPRAIVRHTLRENHFGAELFEERQDARHVTALSNLTTRRSSGLKPTQASAPDQQADVTTSHAANARVRSSRWWAARSRWRPTRKRFCTVPCTETNRCSWVVDLNRRICRSRCRVG